MRVLNFLDECKFQIDESMNQNNLFKRPIGSGKSVFRLELIVLIALKLCLLFFVKQIWFNAPLAHKMHVPPQQVYQKLFSSDIIFLGAKHDRSR